LELAMPVGQWRDVEFSMMCAVSTHEAANTTTLAYTSTSLQVIRSTYATPLAVPFSSTSTERTSAFVSSVRFFVASASGMVNQVGEKNDPTSQPRLQFPQ